MKIQLAVDRVSIPQAIEIIDRAKDSIDIIEIGTSLFKDFGLDALNKIREQFDHSILADIKTMDEAEYEFRQIYEHGGNIATVMGASSLETIRICQRVAREYGQEYMIDTMEINHEKMEALREFEDAILCLHLAKDRGDSLQDYLTEIMGTFQFNNRIAVAGGVKLEDIDLFKELGIDIIIVGSSITKSENIAQAAHAFKERI